MNRHTEPLEDTLIPVPWGHISAKWWGSKERQPVICIHGWQDNAATFDTLIPLLPERISFLCIDLPGHGRSTHLPDGMTYYLIWDGVILLRRLQKQFAWTDLTIMGHSLGGMIGFLFAAVFPDDVDTLIALDVAAPNLSLKDSSLLVQMSGFIDKFLYYDEIKDAKDPNEVYEIMIDLADDGHHGQLTRESCECLMTRGMFPRSNGTYSFSRDNRVKVGWIAPTSPEFVRLCAKNIKCRYMNVKAMPYDSKSWPFYKEICDLIASSAREFKLTFVEGSHHVHLNEPEKVCKHIADFLLFSNAEQYCIV